jgi:hypothetical protein
MATTVPWLTVDQHVELARVAMRVGQLEWNLLCAIADILHQSPEEAEAVLEGLQNDKLIKEARKQLVEVFPEEVSKIDRLFGEIYAVRKQRHEMLHWIWGNPHEEGLSIYFKGTPGKEEEIKYARAEDIAKVADDAQRLTKAVLIWRQAIFDKLNRSKKA